MSMAADVKKGKKGGGSRRAKDLFSSMGQGSMPNRPMRTGLQAMMFQTPMTKRSGKLMPGKNACSVGRSMGQGGK
jgi:hypothetical protein